MKETTPVVVIEWAEDDPPLTIANLQQMRSRFLRRYDNGRFASGDDRPVLLVHHTQMCTLMQETQILSYWYPHGEELKPREVLGFVIREVTP